MSAHRWLRQPNSSSTHGGQPSRSHGRTKAIAERGYADCGNRFPDWVLSYRGTNGLYGRADLAGLNLARYPSVLIELGNMKNTAEAAVLASAEGRSRYASAVTQGIAAYLGSTTPAHL